ncbi:MAG: FHA domain-containing protein [Planctomycetes bacterium]|nr:FHA domain-containing protein [Planctomycetota bacterium]
MSTKLCQNGHVMEASWDRCPYCPDPSRMGRPAVPPTRVSMPAEATPAPLPTPTPAPKPGASAKKTRMMVEEASSPVVGWLVALTGNHKGQDFRVREGKTSIGSDEGNDIQLTDEFISGHHATIKFVQKDGERIFILTDMDSSNGTFLNDAEEPIAREELVDNDTVSFGKTKMKFKCL